MACAGLAEEWTGLAAWLWASATVSSRTMFVPFDLAGALTPFGDLCNFVSPPPRVPPSMPGGVWASNNNEGKRRPRASDMLPFIFSPPCSSLLVERYVCAGSAADDPASVIDSSTGANGYWDDATLRYNLFANRWCGTESS